MTFPTRPLIDSFGRQVTYLRLSVTDRCDLRCTYCMAENMTFLSRKNLLSTEELDLISMAFIRRGVRKIRLTGGEPLVRKDFMMLLEKLGQQLGQGLDELTLTTNGTLLGKYASDIAACGVKRINISLDTLNPETFKTITRLGDIDKVMRGIEAARKAGLKIKINTVVLKNHNQKSIKDMVSWAHARDMDITLIEVMPLGDTDEDRFDQYVPMSVVRNDLSESWTLIDELKLDKNSGPSRYVRIKETGGRLGFITPLTHNFCAGCNRVRVTCTGRIYMCLGQNDFVDLRSVIRESDTPEKDLDKALETALIKKPEKHDFKIKQRNTAPAVSRHMSMTGG